MRGIYFLLRVAFIAPVHFVIVRLAVRRVLAEFAANDPPIIDWITYGATYIDPRHLVIWYLVADNADLEAAKTAGLEERLRKSTRTALHQCRYPSASVGLVHVGPESTENIDKAGGWHHYFH